MQLSVQWGMSAKRKGTRVRGRIYSHYPQPKRLSLIGWLLPGPNNWDENNQARAKNNEVGFVLVRAYNREMITKNVGQKGFSEKENRNTKLPIYIISVQTQFSLHVLDYTLNA